MLLRLCSWIESWCYTFIDHYNLAVLLLRFLVLSLARLFAIPIAKETMKVRHNRSSFGWTEPWIINTWPGEDFFLRCAFSLAQKYLSLNQMLLASYKSHIWCEARMKQYVPHKLSVQPSRSQHLLAWHSSISITLNTFKYSLLWEWNPTHFLRDILQFACAS